MFSPLMKEVFSATDAPPKEARFPKRLSPALVPGARRATEVRSLLIGISSSASVLIIRPDSAMLVSTAARRVPVVTISLINEVVVAMLTLVALPSET